MERAALMLATWASAGAGRRQHGGAEAGRVWTPITASMLADLALEAGLLGQCAQRGAGHQGHEAGAALVAHPGIRRISFTGSPPTARAIRAAAAANLTPVSFELGGKSALDRVRRRRPGARRGPPRPAGATMPARCLAGTRLLVQAAVYDEFLARLTARIAGIRQGDPRDPATEVGPLIRRSTWPAWPAMSSVGGPPGAHLVCGGRVSPALGRLYHEPTLLVDVPAGAEILREEVFGPVLTLQRVADDAEAIALANDTAYGLAGVVFTRDQARADRISDALVAGTVWVNCFFVRDLAAPFGGSRQSGIGREGGHWSFDFYCDVKNVVHRRGTFIASHD
ncbi:MAG: aldehyde dehydrogenase family protein [Vicinamibacterales bacterium]